MAGLRVDRRSALAFRARATHLDARLPRSSFEPVAFAGLQDSSPRSALLSLHARVDEVDPDDWEADGLVQVWGPRRAVYVVLDDDVAVFTLGVLPRDADRQRHLQKLADTVERQAPSAIDQNDLRRAGATGRLRIRWDGRETSVAVTAAPDMDPEDARRELLRRHLRSVGPSTEAGFRWWAGVSPEDASETWGALAAEMERVDVAGHPGVILATDADRVAHAEAVTGARLLPPGDPYLAVVDREVVVPHAADRHALWPASNIWPGGVLVDNELAGTWRRSLRKVTITPWRPLSAKAIAMVEAEALALPIDGGRAAVAWTPSGVDGRRN